MAWLDVEEALRLRLSDLGTAVTRTGTDLQAKLGTTEAPLSVIRVHRPPGGRDQGWQVQARVTVEVYALTRDKAGATAEAVAERLAQRGGFTTAAGTIDRVVSENAFGALPWPDPNVRLLSAMYRVTARR